MNYIKQVLKMLGLKNNEEFMIEGKKELFRINENFGLEIQKKDRGDHWFIGEVYLDKILLGKDKIIKLSFNPEQDEEYWTYINNWAIAKFPWKEVTADHVRKYSGIVFRTSEEARKARPEFYKRITGKYWAGSDNEKFAASLYGTSNEECSAVQNE